jgi:phytoene dehydrogenase-like protein
MIQFGRLMQHMALAVKPILGMVPPDPASMAPSDLAGLLKLGSHFRSLGAERFHALFKLMTMSSADYLDEWFDFDPLKATKSASGIIGTFLGPRSPGSAYVLLHHYMGEIDGAFRAWGFQKGGTGAISNSIASAARAFGADIRTDAGVEKVIVKDGRATGVALSSGEEIAAPLVVSCLDPRRTFTQLVDTKDLPGDLVEGVRRYKFRGSSGKVNLALDGLPDLTCLPWKWAAPPGRHLDQPESRLSGAGVRRRQVRRVLTSSIYGHRHPVDDRSPDGAAGQARDEHLRAVRALPPEWRMDRREA